MKDKLKEEFSLLTKDTKKNCGNCKFRKFQFWFKTRPRLGYTEVGEYLACKHPDIKKISRGEEHHFKLLNTFHRRTCKRWEQEGGNNERR